MSGQLGTDSSFKVNGKELNKGIRQDCRISKEAFNIQISDFEKELGKVNEGGLVVGKKLIWYLCYADDIVLMSTNEAGVRQQMEKNITTECWKNYFHCGERNKIKQEKKRNIERRKNSGS